MLFHRRLHLERLEDRHLLAGATLMPHGFGGSIAGWLTEMANAMAEATGEVQARYTLEVTDPGHDGGPLSVVNTLSSLPALTSAATKAPQVVILLDWSDVAGSFSVGSYVRNTADVASAVASALTTPGFLTGLPDAVSQLPLHLMGHSRGGSLVGELARNLAQRGIWVDQVTTLDPHPVDGIRDPFGIDFGDAAMAAWEGVVFWDNYWRTDGDTSFDFTGEPIAGSHDIQLSEAVLGNFTGYLNEHSDVHLWYHGTIDTTGVIDDGSASVAANAGWYAGAMGPRDQIGYYFSRAVGGTRPAAGLAAGIGDGQAPRVPILHVLDRWPSLLDVQLLSQPVLTVGDPLDVRYAWHDYDSSASLEFFLDNDRNPFNGTGPQVGLPITVARTFPASLSTDQTALSTAGLDPGSYELVARISDATGDRLLYADRGVELQETTLTVTEFLPTSSGFVAEFSSELDASVLNLYDSESVAAGSADVTVVDTAQQPVTGSLVLGASGRKLTFVKTGTPLAPGLYGVTLRSGSRGLKAVTGEMLDGNADGVAGDDYGAVLNVAVPDPGTVTVSVPDFVRGPGQEVHIPADVSTGVPLSVSASPGLRNVSVTVQYDPGRLEIVSAVVDAAIPAGASASLDTSSPGMAVVTVISPADLPAEGGTFVHLQAEVPAANAGSIYGTSQVLDLGSIVVTDANSSPVASIADDGVHVVMYLGDVSGNGRINSSDASRVARVASLLDSGFSSSLTTDPLLLADISGNVRVNALDASLVAQFTALIPVPQIPPVPTVLVAGARDYFFAHLECDDQSWLCFSDRDTLPEGFRSADARVLRA